MHFPVYKAGIIRYNIKRYAQAQAAARVCPQSGCQADFCFGKVFWNMLQFEELKRELHDKQAALDELKDALGLERLREEVEMLENKAAEPGFWDNMEAAQKVLQRTAALKQKRSESVV